MNEVLLPLNDSVIELKSETIRGQMNKLLELSGDSRVQELVVKVLSKIEGVTELNKDMLLEIAGMMAEVISSLPDGDAKQALMALTSKMAEVVQSMEGSELEEEKVAEEEEPSEEKKDEEKLEEAAEELTKEVSNKLKEAAEQITSLKEKNDSIAAELETKKDTILKLEEQLKVVREKATNFETELSSYKEAEEKEALAKKTALVGQVLEFYGKVGEKKEASDFEDYNEKQLLELKSALEVKANSAKIPNRKTDKGSTVKTNPQKTKVDKDAENAKLLFKL